MILYALEPLELLEKNNPQQTVIMKLPSGGLLTVEVCDNNNLKVLSLNSTDPMDYLNSQYQPGSIISLEARLNSMAD